jgi:hypothetical protein
VRSRGNEQARDVAEASENAAPLHDLTPSNIGMWGEQMGTNRAESSMRVLSERLVGNYEIVATEKEAKKVPLNELQEWPENLWRRVAEAEAALNAERVAHEETRQKLEELIGAKEDGVSPKDVSLSPVIEVGRKMRMKMTHADAASMTKCSEDKSRAKRITDDEDWRDKIERGRRIFEHIRARTDKMVKSA